MFNDRRSTARTGVLTFGSLLVAVLLAWAFWGRADNATAAPSAEQRLLTFAGTGTAQIAPDSATISAGVSGSGDNANAAQAMASRKMRKLIAHMKGQGLADSQLQTSDASTYEDWEHKGRFTSSQSLTIDVTNPAGAGKLLGEATAGGADTVSGPSFGLKDQRAGYSEALRQAIADARAKADAAAAQMDAKVIAVFTIDESLNQATPMYTERAMATASDKAAVDVPV
ncbi:MAG: SIMPL domain-containing protein, partial [Thermoleophilia bacterium]|nr:SIMPL domain-containing protein [Thermoleophilia bacterium]